MSAVSRVGGVRPSQLMFSHGIGSLVDLPNFSVVVGGLDDWDELRQERLTEQRLLSAVRVMKGHERVEALKAAPWMEETKNPRDDWARTGVPVFPFPRWLRCTSPKCNLLLPIDSGLLDLKAELYHPDRTRYVHNCSPGRRPPLAIPARFVTACPRGHLDEFPWVEFCHHKGPCSGSPLLRVFEIGGSRSTDLQVECVTCGQKMHLSQAFGEPGRRTMPRCRGRHPHLRRFDPAGCRERMRAVLLGASNAWFPVTKSVLSLPVSWDPLDQLVEEHWADLSRAMSLDMLKGAVEFSPTLRVFASQPLAKLWAAIEARRGRGGATAPVALDLLGPEWALFDAPADVPPSADFTLREVDSVPAHHRGRIRRVVLAERLRVVTAMCGFTRIDGPDSGVADDVGSFECAPLSRDAPTWVPAAEARGEGLFVALSEDAVSAWVERVGDTARMSALAESHGRWRERRGLNPSQRWPGLRYVLLHSLAHVLINELTLECGYSAASVQERIYAREPGDPGGSMAGLLIYTAAADSEGTLGGLVALGSAANFGRLLDQALERAKLCSADPLCAEHEPGADEEALHNAACHACLFVPETSCERGNRYLDRATLVPTMSGDAIHFFDV